MINKIQNVGLYILQKYGREAGTIELNKLFYLVDVSYYRLFGETLSGINYIRAEKGPYSREISQELCLLQGKGISRERKPSRGFSSYPKIAWSIEGGTKVRAALASEEREVIDRVLNKVRGLTPIQLEKLSYSTEPMRYLLAKESEDNCPLLQEQLDFAKLKLNNIMQEFLAHSKTPVSLEERESLSLSNEEWAEVELLLQSN